MNAVKTLPARNESDFLQNDFSITSNVFWIEQAAPEIHRVVKRLVSSQNCFRRNVSRVFHSPHLPRCKNVPFRIEPNALPI